MSSVRNSVKSAFFNTGEFTMEQNLMRTLSVGDLFVPAPPQTGDYPWVLVIWEASLTFPGTLTDIHITASFCGRSHFTSTTWLVHPGGLSHYPSLQQSSPIGWRKSWASWALFSDKSGRGSEPVLAQRTLSSAGGLQRTSFFRDIVVLRECFTASQSPNQKLPLTRCSSLCNNKGRLSKHP